MQLKLCAVGKACTDALPAFCVCSNCGGHGASSVATPAGGGVMAAAEVIKDDRVSLKGRACAAGCLKLYMARTSQEVAASATAASVSGAVGAAPGTAPGQRPQTAVPASSSIQPVASTSGQATMQPALGASATLGASLLGLSGTVPVLAPPPKKPKPPVGKSGVKKKGEPTEAVTFALGWFADSGENEGEERLWLEEQMLVADGVKEKVPPFLVSFHIHALCIAPRQ